MQHRIILVDFCWTRDKDPRVPLGHASILATLRQEHELDVRSIVVTVNEECARPEQVVASILKETKGTTEERVDVAFGAYVWGEQLLQRSLAGLRQAGFRGRVILGGPQVSYAGKGLERIYPEVDVFIRGYGEQALAALVRTRSTISIPGVHWAGTPDILGQAAISLEELPSPWLNRTISLNSQRFVRWETQRGCPFRCAFCQHREPGKRLLRRALHLPRIRQEIDLFCASQVREIAVLDPIFNLAPHAVQVLERFASLNFAGRLSLQCRAEAITDTFLKAASQIDVCLEFGLQTIHLNEGRVIQRGNHLDKVEVALSKVRALGLHHEVSLIYGLPFQTLESFKRSVAWCLHRKVPVIKAFPLLLLRGTALEGDREKWDLRDSGGAMPQVVESSTFSVADHREMARISQALRATEGHHPSRIEELIEVGAQLEPRPERWAPAG